MVLKGLLELLWDKDIIWCYADRVKVGRTLAVLAESREFPRDRYH